MATATATPTRKKIKFRPTDDRVLIQPSEATDTTSGGIILPDTAKEKPQRGTIIAIGPGKLLDSGKRGEMGVEIGDEVSTASTGAPESGLPSISTSYSARPTSSRSWIGKPNCAADASPRTFIRGHRACARCSETGGVVHG